MLDHGHTRAATYTIGCIYDESELVVRRLNGMEKTRAILLQQAVSSLLSKKGQGVFKETLKKLKT